MFFTKVARIVAWFVLINAVGLLGIGLVGAFSAEDPAILQEFRTIRTTGQMIDAGIIAGLISLAFGVLVEISVNLRRILASVNEG